MRTMYARLRIFEFCGFDMSESARRQRKQTFILKIFAYLLTNTIAMQYPSTFDIRHSTFDIRQGNLCALASCLKRKNSFQHSTNFSFFFFFITSNVNIIVFTFFSSQNHAGLNPFVKRQNTFNPVFYKSNRSLQKKAERACFAVERKTQSTYPRRCYCRRCGRVHSRKII